MPQHSFNRTTDTIHHEKVIYLWQRLSEAGAIYKGEHSGWYCTSEETFYPESRLVLKSCQITGREDRVTADSGKPVEWVTETNYKFRLGDYLGRVRDWLVESRPVAPPSRLNDLHEIFSEGLPDLSISRSRDKNPWGLPVPGDPSQTVYVWLDALANYLDPIDYSVPEVHVIGKDILKFHAIYWPSFLMAAGLPLPKTILTHGHWILGKEKMSKSLGNIVDPVAEMQKYGLDSFRYLMLRLGRVDADCAYEPASLLKIYELELVNTMANLLSRVANPIFYPTADRIDFSGVNSETLEACSAMESRVVNAYDEHRFYLGLENIMKFFVTINSKINEVKPWQMAKSGKDEELNQFMSSTLYSLFEGISLMRPIMPSYVDCITSAQGHETNGMLNIQRFLSNSKRYRLKKAIELS